MVAQNMFPNNLQELATYLVSLSPLLFLFFLSLQKVHRLSKNVLTLYPWDVFFGGEEYGSTWDGQYPSSVLSPGKICVTKSGLGSLGTRLP